MTPLDPPYSAGLASALPMTRYLSLLIIVFTAVLLARPAVGQTATDRRNSIVAEVNDKIITRQMVTDAMGREAELLRRQYARQPQLFGQKYTQLQADTLEALIRRELVLIEYQEKGYKLPESIIEQRILEDIRTEYGNRVTLIKSLQQSDMTYEEFARYQREKIIQMVMRGQFISKANIVISPRQIEEYYVANKDAFRSGVEIRLRIIFLDAKKHGGAEDTRKLAAEMHRVLQTGDSFAGVAGSPGSGAGKGRLRAWPRAGESRRDDAPGMLYFALRGDEPGQAKEPRRGSRADRANPAGDRATSPRGQVVRAAQAQVLRQAVFILINCA